MEQHAEIQALRRCMEVFLEKRCAEKISEKKGADEAELDKIRARFRRETWLADAARRSSRIHLATHVPKYSHPDAGGSGLLYMADAAAAVPAGYVGTNSCSLSCEDAWGNAADLDVFKFLKLEHEGKSLSQRVLEHDVNLLAAFSDNRELAESWMADFLRFLAGDSRPLSHELAKQVYFPLENGGYHLLSPLFPTSLVQQVYLTLREDRFGEGAGEARKAHHGGLACSHGYCEYPDMLTQKFGGTKPQNISQLNSERHGENWLLPSLPPVWGSGRMRLPLRVTSVFGPTLGNLPEVVRARRALVSFLERTAGEYTNIRIRRTRAALLKDLLTAVVEWAARIRAEAPGWSADAACHLPEEECFWLDPRRGELDSEWQEQRNLKQWVDVLLDRAASWCNGQLTTRRLGMGDDEHHAWKRELAEAICQLEDGGMA